MKYWQRWQMTFPVLLLLLGCHNPAQEKAAADSAWNSRRELDTAVLKNILQRLESRNDFTHSKILRGAITEIEAATPKTDTPGTDAEPANAELGIHLK